MEQVSVIRIDLAKNSFQLHGARVDGSVAFRRKLSRGKVLRFLASQPGCPVAIGLQWPHRDAPTCTEKVYYATTRRGARVKPERGQSGSHTHVGDMGSLVLSPDQALDEIANNGILWTWTW